MVRKWNTCSTSLATTTCTVKPREKRARRFGIGGQCLLLRRDVVAVSLPARPWHSPPVGHRIGGSGGAVIYLRREPQNLASIYCLSRLMGALDRRGHDQRRLQLGGNDRRRGAGCDLVLFNASLGGFARKASFLGRPRPQQSGYVRPIAPVRSTTRLPSAKDCHNPEPDGAGRLHS